MKIKTKLILFMAIMIILPITAVNMFSSSRSEENSITIIRENIENLTLNRAGSINFYFEEITSAAKDLASADEIGRYAADSNNGTADISAESEYRTDIENKLINMSDNDPSIRKIMIINNAGDIIASTDPNDAGSRMSNYDGLFTIASGNNGISPLFMSGDDADDIPMFILIKPVYSGDNERQGIVYQLHDTSYLQKLITNVQFDKYTASAIMDNSGNIFEYPYKSIKSYSDSENFKESSDYLRSIINKSSTGEPANYYEYKVKRGTRMVFSSEIPSCGWTMLNVSDKFNISSEANKAESSIRNFSIIILILSCVGCGIFIFFFTKPLDNIMDTLRKKLKGDTSAHFNIRTRDEFREIAGVFDVVFEDVFELEQRYKTIVEITNNIVFEINMETAHVTVSKNFNQKFSHRPKDDTLAESFIHKMRVHKDDKERFNADFSRIFSKTNSFQGEYRVKDIYGEFIWIMIKATKFYNSNDVPTKIMGVIMDIDKEKKSEMHLIQRASFDNLTQLYNREAFLKSLTKQIEIAASKKTLDAIMFIDLDDFKFFNDQYGHACGDEVLKFVADTLKEICFEHGFAGRFGGDEFVMCLTGLTLYGDSGNIAQEIIDTLGAGFISESTGVKLNIHCSVGIAFLIESGKTAEDVIAAADEAMYNIKKHGKSAYAYARSHNSAEHGIDEVLY